MPHNHDDHGFKLILGCPGHVGIAATSGSDADCQEPSSRQLRMALNQEPRGLFCPRARNKATNKQRRLKDLGSELFLFSRQKLGPFSNLSKQISAPALISATGYASKKFGHAGFECQVVFIASSYSCFDRSVFFCFLLM